MNSTDHSLLISSLTCLLFLGNGPATAAQGLATHALPESQALAISDQAKLSEPKPSNAQKSDDTYLSKELKRLPGVNVKPQQLQTDEQPVWVNQNIKGFHPVKKMLQPIIHLEANSTALEKQIMRLEGPIAGLQAPMLGLHKRMTSVENKMGDMQGQLGGMQTEVSDVAGRINSIDHGMAGVRQDLGAMRKQISQLQGPIQQLKDPISGVAYPLTQVRQELGQMKSLLATVLLAILIAAIAVAVGTPIAAILIYRNRRKLFPDMHDHEFPVASRVTAEKVGPGSSLG